MLAWLKKAWCRFFLHDDCDGKEAVKNGIRKGMRNGSDALFWSSFVMGLVLGGMLLSAQFFPKKFAASEGFVSVYLYFVSIFVIANHAELWFTTSKRFRYGERIFYFWMIVIVISALMHFFSGGTLVFPKDAFTEIAIWISGAFGLSKISSGFRKKTLDKVEKSS